MIDTKHLKSDDSYINQSQSDECSNKYLEQMNATVSIRIRLKLYYTFKIKWMLKYSSHQTLS